MILSLFVIGFFQIYKINESSITTILPDAGLIAGAKYELNFFDTNTESFFIALLDEEEYSLLPRLSFTYASQFCSRIKSHFARINATILSHIYDASLSIAISKPGTYRPLVVSCKAPSSHYTVSVHFKNGETLLDARRIPSLISMPIELCVVIVSFVPWVMNQYKYWKIRLSLHNFISLSMLFTIADIVLKYIILWHDSNHDQTSVFHFLEKITKIGCDILVFSTIILASKGWCIVFPNLRPKDITEVVLFCTVYLMFRTLSSNINLLIFNIVLFGLTTLLILILWASLLSGIRNVDRQILAHMFVISRAGVNPISTPIHTKQMVYTLLKHIIIIYLSCCIATMSLELADITSYWMRDTINVIVHTGILIALSALFHVRKVDMEIYSQIKDKVFNEEEIDHQLLDDLESNSIYENNKDLIMWKEGMPLPPQPKIVMRKEEYEGDVDILL